MADSSQLIDLAGHLVDTARAHHAATGGVNPEWATWYSARLVDAVNEALGSQLDQGELHDWLVAADLRYRSDDQDEGWPKAYARWLIEDFG